MDSNEKMVVGTQNRFVKWWLRTRDVPGTIGYDKNGMRYATAEFYCPWWAKPLDLLYNLVYGKVRLYA